MILEFKAKPSSRKYTVIGETYIYWNKIDSYNLQELAKGFVNFYYGETPLTGVRYRKHREQLSRRCVVEVVKIITNYYGPSIAQTFLDAPQPTKESYHG